MDYDQQEYNEFLKYIKSTWGALFDNDWINKPQIDEIIIDLYKNEFTVCVKLKENSYYRFKNKELIIEEYDTDKYIKTTYAINDTILLYMLVNARIINDLGLQNAKIFINPTWIDHLPIHKYLSKELEHEEESYAEVLYCIAHDL